MVATVRRQNTLHHMLARRILTAITRPADLDIAAIVPRDFRGTRICEDLVDAKVMNKSLLIFLGFLVTPVFVFQLTDL